MAKRRSPTLLYWLLQFAGLGLTIVYLSWHFHVTDRVAIPEPEFLSVLIVLLVCAPFTKGPSLIAGHFLVRSHFWQVNLFIVRVLLYYFLDLACSAAMLSALWLYIIGWLFTDAGFPIAMTIFPYAIVNGVILAWYTPRPVRTAPGRPAEPEPVPAQKPVREAVQAPPRDHSNDRSLVPPVIISLALLLSFASGFANNDNWYGAISLSLFVFPLLLISGWLYLVPATLAFRRIPHQARAVLLVNLLTGWLVVGWLACLAWALVTKASIKRSPATIPWRKAGLVLLGMLGLVIQAVGLGLFEDAGYAVPGFILLTIGSLLLLLAITRYFPARDMRMPA